MNIKNTQEGTNKIKDNENSEDDQPSEGRTERLLENANIEPRSRFRGGVSRQGQIKGHHLIRPKVIVTANARPGQMLDDTIAMDRNLPPPRLVEASMNQRQQSTYRVNYPGAKLRVAAPRPSRGGTVSSSRRDTPPQSISFGSTSYSTGAYHRPREPNSQEYILRDQPQRHNVPREPVTYYNPSHPPINPIGPRPQKPRLQFPKDIPQIEIHQNLAPPPPPSQQQLPPSSPDKNNNDSRRKDFKPSKLLPPITNPPSSTTNTISNNQSNEARLPLPPLSVRPSKRKNSDISNRDPGDNESYPSPPPSRRGQVVNAPRPSLVGAVANKAGDSTASLAPLGTISKSGVRPEIGHRSGSTAGHSPSGSHLWPPAQSIPGRQPGSNYKRQNDGSYTFISGEVYTPPPLIKRPTNNRSSQKPTLRITTRRPGSSLPIIPFEDNVSTYVPRYVKEVKEVEFESKTFEAAHEPPSVYHHRPNWFLMPVQGWFVLSIILAALLIVLIVVCAILYKSLRKQKQKVKKLLSPTLSIPTCIDPVNHEMCQCRSLAPLVRSHTLMSRASRRSIRPSSRRQGIINYDNDSQQRTTGFRSLPNPALMDQEKDNNLDSITTTHTHIEVDDTPPPLAPKKSSLVGTGVQNEGGRSGSQESKNTEETRIVPIGGRESRASISHDSRGLGVGGYRETRLGLPEGGRSSSSLGGYMGGSSYGGKGTSTQHHRTAYHSSDVQLTTIYPPPRRFEL